ncbi:MAG: DUF262 domain-containing protein [Thermoplasmata archaeon]
METKQEHWPLLTLKEYEKDIDPNPTYQRSEVWKPDQKQLLIDSVLRQIDVPKLYLRKLPTLSRSKYEIIDGQQRMRTFWDFLSDGFSLDEESDDILLDGRSYEIAGKKYSELDSTLKIERVHKYTLNVVIISDATEDEIADLFFRLNNGTPLNPAEVRNSMPGKMTEFVRQLAQHEFFHKCSFANRRKAFDQVATQIVCLEINGGIHDTRDKVLSKMYADHASDLSESLKTTVDTNLNILNRIFPEKTRLLNRASVINNYLLISYLTKHSRIKEAVPQIREWYMRTEPIRRKITEYNVAMTRSANSWSAIDIRFRILLLDFTKEYQTFDLVQLDERRMFSEDQKIEIYQRDQGICKGCAKHVSEYNWHADHIIPWVKSGRTEVENGQVLCVKCNIKKGSRLW